MDEAKIISLRKEPELLDMFCTYFSKNWGREVIYRNCMESSLSSDSPLPQWFLLVKKDEICGGCGLITNDFISRMDLYPWLCALFIEPEYRGRALGSLLIEKCKEDSRKAGFPKLYLCTDHVGYYEHYGFTRIGTGYHPWGETSGIFEAQL